MNTSPLLPMDDPAPGIELGADPFGDPCLDPIDELEAKLLAKTHVRSESECFGDCYGTDPSGFIYPFPTTPDEWFRDEMWNHA